MNLILFFLLLIKGMTFIGAAFIIAMIVDIVIGIVYAALTHLPIFLVCILIDIVLLLIFKLLGYPVKPMMWTFLFTGILSFNPVVIVSNIIGIILSYIFIF